VYFFYLFLTNKKNKKSPNIPFKFYTLQQQLFYKEQKKTELQDKKVLKKKDQQW
jgi:hypothetical protein